MDDNLKKQIEDAFSFRGHVTVRFKDGKSLEGFLFNRQYSNPKLKEDNFVELMLKGSEERRRFPIPTLASIVLTGEDCAAGNSYEDYLKKKKAQG